MTTKLRDVLPKCPGLNIEKLLAKSKARCEAEKPRLLKKYSLSEITDREIGAILRAEAEEIECVNCRGGTCQKRHNQNKKPVIRVENGALKISSVECEYSRRIRLRRQFKRARLPEKYLDKTFKDYVRDEKNSEAIQIAKWYVAKFPAKSLYYYGGCGAGKTFLATLIAQEFIRGGKSVIFGDVPSLLEEIKRTFNGQGSSQEIIDSYCECDLLILDDLGAGYVTEWNIGVLYQIVNGRYNAGKVLIVTSNFDMSGLRKRLTDKDTFSAERIISRLSEMCIQGFLGAFDRRSKNHDDL